MRLLLALSLLLALIVPTASAQSEGPAPPRARRSSSSPAAAGGTASGMSQYGAYGMARAGYDHEEILAHYYYGTDVGRTGTKQVRVSARRGQARRDPVVAGPVHGGRRERGEVPPRSRRAPLKPGLVFRTETGRVRAAPPATVRPGKASTLSFDGRLFRGQIEVAVEKGSSAS